jgi:hypothetical protein
MEIAQIGFPRGSKTLAWKAQTREQGSMEIFLKKECPKFNKKAGKQTRVAIMLPPETS